jgi:hypothetical protein
LGVAAPIAELPSGTVPFLFSGSRLSFEEAIAYALEEARA